MMILSWRVRTTTPTSARPGSAPDRRVAVTDVDAITAGFERNGFTGPLNRYRNFTRDWEDLAAFDDPRQPTVFITGERDSTRLWLGDAIKRQAQWLPAHTGTHVIPDCGHWVQQERPDEVNALLLDFLNDLTR